MIDNGVLPADQMAATVTRPVEEAMSGVLKIQRIRSTTTRGGCEINLFFDWNANMDLELQLRPPSGLSSTTPSWWSRTFIGTSRTATLPARR